MALHIPTLSPQEVYELRCALVGNGINLRAWFVVLTVCERTFTDDEAREQVAKLATFLRNASIALAQWHARLAPIARDD